MLYVTPTSTVVHMVQRLAELMESKTVRSVERMNVFYMKEKPATHHRLSDSLQFVPRTAQIEETITTLTVTW